MLLTDAGISLRAIQQEMGHECIFSMIPIGGSMA
jgi:hypothetical protein